MYDDVRRIRVNTFCSGLFSLLLYSVLYTSRNGRSCLRQIKRGLSSEFYRTCSKYVLSQKKHHRFINILRLKDKQIQLHELC